MEVKIGLRTIYINWVTAVQILLTVMCVVEIRKFVSSYSSNHCKIKRSHKNNLGIISMSLENRGRMMVYQSYIV